MICSALILPVKKHNSTRAGSFVDELRDLSGNRRDAACLSGRPQRFDHSPPRPWQYLIFYQIEADRVEILRVLHGAMNYESLLFPDS
jgi:plasmid stabilization system protein ParE